MRQLFASPIPIWMVFGKLTPQHLETNVTGVGTTAVVRVFNRVSLGGTITFDTDQTDFTFIVVKFDNDDGVVSCWNNLHESRSWRVQLG